MTFETYFGSDKFNLYQTIIPYKGSKKGLLIYRIIVFIILCYGLYGSIYCTLNVGPGMGDNWMWFCFFTNQSFIAIMIYFIIGIINYFRDAKGTLKGKISNTYLHTILHIFYNILLPISFAVTVIFWGLIIPWLDTSYFTFTHWAANVILHFLQFVAITIDWFLMTIPTNYHHFIPMLTVGIVYLIYAQIYHLIYDIWIYRFLDPTKSSIWYVIYIGLVIVWTLFGLAAAGIQKFKNRNRKFIIDRNGNSEPQKANDIELA